MKEEVRQRLLEWAETYHCAEFIQNDPVQFPHRYAQKQDIEISGLLTAIMSFGNRKQILKKADELHALMGASPYQYVLSRRWETDFPATNNNGFYRMLSHADFNSYFRRLHAAYSSYSSLEDALWVHPGSPMEKLCAFLEVSAKSPQKKLNMFLRWMIRKGPEVDFGIWESFDCRELIIPLDTHVCRVAHLLGLTDTDTFSLKNARRITDALAEVFPDDPCLGDFALFGSGVNGGYIPTHPGEVLKDEIEYRKISQRKLAEQMGISYKALNDLLNGRRTLTISTAMMFEAALDIPADSLMRLQLKYFLADSAFNNKKGSPMP